MRLTQKKVLVEEFARFIERLGPWHMFITLTFRREKNSMFAKKCLKVLMKYINTDDITFFDKYVICFTVFEKEHVRNSVHLHLFLKGIDPTKADALKNRCLDFIFKRTHNGKVIYERLFEQVAIYPYEAEKRARFYLANKYISPDTDYWDIFRINARKRGGKGGKIGGFYYDY